MTVKRWSVGVDGVDPNGNLVKYDDYAILLAERDALKVQVVSLAVENAAPTNGCGFFAYDPDNRFEKFKTKGEAIAAAESYIDYYRGDTCDGRADEVAQVAWGIIMQESTKVDERPKKEEASVSPYINPVCDFRLLPVIEHSATDTALAKIQTMSVEKFGDKLLSDLRGDCWDEHDINAIEIHINHQLHQLRKGARNG